MKDKIVVITIMVFILFGLYAIIREANNTEIKCIDGHKYRCSKSKNRCRPVTTEGRHQPCDLPYQ